MKLITLISFALLSLIACNNQNKLNTNKAKQPSTNLSIDSNNESQFEPDLTDNDFRSLMKYIGKYPKETDFFDNPLVNEELKKILKDDFKSYLKFVSIAGCGEMNYKYGLVYGDISQLHVGGYSSLIFIDIDNKSFFLFWLKETVRDKNYKIYGQSPIQANVLNLIEQEMNISWGHVAEFLIKGDSISIKLK
jgi:hypothetical protein